MVPFSEAKNEQSGAKEINERWFQGFYSLCCSSHGGTLHVLMERNPSQKLKNPKHFAGLANNGSMQSHGRTLISARSSQGECPPFSPDKVICLSVWNKTTVFSLASAVFSVCKHMYSCNECQNFIFIIYSSCIKMSGEK